MSNLIAPVYLNQRMVFDMIAMMQGGLATVTAVSKSSSSNQSDHHEMGGSFGLNQAISSLFKVNFSAHIGGEAGNAQSKQYSEERVHTPASLFFQLRAMLTKEDKVKVIDDSKEPRPGDIIEFETSLKRNPIIETLDSFVEMIDLAILFQDDQPQGKKQKSQQNSQEQQIKKQMEGLSERLKSGNTIDLTTSKIGEKYSAVVTLESEFLNDPMMSDLVDGKFKVLGKVIRCIEEDGEPISLIRKTALSKMPQEILNCAFGSLNKLKSQEGFDIPAMEWQMQGPAFQVLPISIFA